jgi:hypothetical protein
VVELYDGDALFYRREFADHGVAVTIAIEALRTAASATQ